MLAQLWVGLVLIVTIHKTDNANTVTAFLNVKLSIKDTCQNKSFHYGETRRGKRNRRLAWLLHLETQSLKPLTW